MRVYKVIPGPTQLKFNQNNIALATQQFQGIINSEAKLGWVYHSMEWMKAHQNAEYKSGCFGSKEVQAAQDATICMLIFYREQTEETPVTGEKKDLYVSESPYVEITCPHCGKIMRVHKDMVKGKVKCPFCQKIVDLAPAPKQAPSFTPDSMPADTMVPDAASTLEPTSAEVSQTESAKAPASSKVVEE